MLKVEKARQSESSLTSSVNIQLKRFSYNSEKEGVSIGSTSLDSRYYRRQLGKFFGLDEPYVKMLKIRFFVGLVLTEKPRLWKVKRFKSFRHEVLLTRTFSNSDFTNCQCKAILNTMYSQMIEHCNGAGYVEKLNDCMVEYACLCILCFNIPQALRILDEALYFVKVRNHKQKQTVKVFLLFFLCLLLEQTIERRRRKSRMARTIDVW